MESKSIRRQIFPENRDFYLPGRITYVKGAGLRIFVLLKRSNDPVRRKPSASEEKPNRINPGKTAGIRRKTERTDPLKTRTKN